PNGTTSQRPGSSSWQQDRHHGRCTTSLLRVLTQNPAGFSMQWMQICTVRVLVRVSCPASCSCACSGSLSAAIRKWCPAAQLSATCLTGPSVLGREKRSVTSAGTPQSGHDMTVSNVLPSQDTARLSGDVGTEPALCAC